MPSCLRCENAFPFPAPVKYSPVPGGEAIVIYGRCVIKDADFTDEEAIAKENACAFYVESEEVGDSEPLRKKTNYKIEELAELSDVPSEAEPSGFKDELEATDVPKDSEAGSESRDVPGEPEPDEDDSLRISTLDIFDGEEL